MKKEKFTEKHLMETPLAQHDWAHITTAGDRRKYGHHRIRKCRNCGALERYDPSTLKRVYQAGPLILDKPIQCDAWHKDLAREIGLEYRVAAWRRLPNGKFNFRTNFNGSFCQTAVMCWAVYQH